MTISNRLPIPHERLKPERVRIRQLPSEAAMRAGVAAFIKATMPPRPAPGPTPEAPSVSHARNEQPAVAPPKAPQAPKYKRPKNGYESCDVFAAIDAQDVVRLADICDFSFKLLLQAQPTTGMTPLKSALNRMKYAAQNSEGEKAVCFALMGHLSRWANHLPHKELFGGDKAILNALTNNLKLATDFGLEHNYHEPLPAYVEVLLASKGTHWLQTNVDSVARLVCDGQGKQAYASSAQSVNNVIGKELAEYVYAVEDVRMNAITDLLMLGCSKALSTSTGGLVSPISLNHFARDVRILDEFKERARTVDNHIKETGLTVRGYAFSTKVLAAMSDRRLGYTAKVDALFKACNWSN